MPLAESTGFIHELTQWVILRAAHDAKAWADAGDSLVVSVNLSARCLIDVNLPQKVRDTLNSAGLPAHMLKLEITESAIIVDPVRALDVINRLHDLGVALSIDYFGTGYTSLAYLRDLPVQEIKIDQSFRHPYALPPQGCGHRADRGRARRAPRAGERRRRHRRPGDPCRPRRNGLHYRPGLLPLQTPTRRRTQPMPAGNTAMTHTFHCPHKPDSSDTSDVSTPRPPRAHVGELGSTRRAVKERWPMVRRHPGQLALRRISAESR